MLLKYVFKGGHSGSSFSVCIPFQYGLHFQIVFPNYNFFFPFLGIDFVFIEDIYYSLLLFHFTVFFFRDYYYRYIETYLPTSLSVFSLISYCFPHFLFLQFSFFLCISFKKLSIEFSSSDILYNYFYYWIYFISIFLSSITLSELLKS